MNTTSQVGWIGGRVVIRRVVACQMEDRWCVPYAPANMDASVAKYYQLRNNGSQLSPVISEQLEPSGAKRCITEYKSGW